jgi:hypothetical protein
MTPAEAEAQAHEAMELIFRIHPLLHGQDRLVQGAVLAELLARWLAGHFVGADKLENATFRAELLAEHLASVVRLVPLCEAELLERTKRGSS